MPVVGTAGHVDHGKSTLVLSLTGRDPDRWDEEKQRGLTIDLGFAWTDLGVGDEVAFVDVPGHERFIKNMLAGVGAVDVALFVVAADSGWMPQSEEHLAILDLLEIRHGVVALTRVDLVDADLRELAALEVEDQVAGTALEGWPIVPVSGVTGAGMEELRTALRQALVAAGPPVDRGRPRLWVDRVFGVAGVGAVVTGTLVGGSVSVDDVLELAPSGDQVRVRGLQRHERGIDSVAPGNRVAVNLGGVDRERLGRGTLLVSPGSVVGSRRMLVSLRSVRGLDAPPGDRGAYHLHLGTAGVPVRLRIVGTWESGGAFGVLTASAPLPVAMGDRFVLRETGRQAVVAGGRVLDPFAARVDVAQARRLASAVDGMPEERAAALLAVHGTMSITDLAAAAGSGAVPGAVVADGMAVAEAEAARLTAAAAEQVVRYHGAYPLRPGMPKAELASRMGIAKGLLELLLARGGELVDEGSVVRSEGFEVRLGPEDEDRWRAARAILSASPAVPRASSLDLPDELLHALVRTGRLVAIGDDQVFLPEHLEEITSRLGELPDPFSVSAFREHFGLSRRHAVPVLEWLDARGWTRRSGDVRTLRRRD